MNFVSFAELHADIAAWERRLPEFDAVVGVPRSGLIPAAYIALRRNIRLVEFQDFLAQPDGSIERALVRDNNPLARSGMPCGNRVLVVDDAASDKTRTFNSIRARLRDCRTLDVRYGAVYRCADSDVEFSYRELELPRVFEWNWIRHRLLRHSMLDLDGVLCEDWKTRPEVDGDPEFLAHVESARPLYVPQQPILAVVTSRIERHRPATEAWLKRHGVNYSHLIMHPAATPEERRRLKDHAQRKAAAYLADGAARLFVESDARLAGAIADIARKPVLCTDTMTFYAGGGEPA